MRHQSDRDTVNHEIERLLTQHYGDGEVYFTSAADQLLFQAARQLGLVSENGMLTAIGRQRVAVMLH